jgi:UDP-2,3-diacylglucosamine hydrolase
MNRPDYIVSDIHLGAVPVATEKAFLSFLEHAASEAASLLIVGDLFDFWFEYGSIIHGKHFRVLAALARLVESGVPVSMVGGNHDAWGGRFLQEEVGMKFVPGALRLTLGGRSALAIHGDGVGVGDFKYRALKAVIRSRAATWAFRMLHPEVGHRLARAVSTTEAKAGSGDESSEGRTRYIEDWAKRTLREDPGVDVVVCGHAHIPRILEVEPGRYYLNAGDWIDDFTYITLRAGEAPQLQTWDQAARL